MVANMTVRSATLDATFAALADAGRRSMLAQLTRGPASVSKLARPLSMSLPAVMQHLAVLEQAGLVRSQKLGRVRLCRLEPQALSVAQQWISQRRSEWEQRLDRLGEYLNTVKQRGESDEHGK
jgi:DNA-binding transcriptional ArsR family regulator